MGAIIIPPSIHKQKKTHYLLFLLNNSTHTLYNRNYIIIFHRIIFCSTYKVTKRKSFIFSSFHAMLCIMLLLLIIQNIPNFLKTNIQFAYKLSNSHSNRRNIFRNSKTKSILVQECQNLFVKHY